MLFVAELSIIVICNFAYTPIEILDAWKTPRERFNFGFYQKLVVNLIYAKLQMYAY